MAVISGRDVVRKLKLPIWEQLTSKNSDLGEVAKYLVAHLNSYEKVLLSEEAHSRYNTYIEIVNSGRPITKIEADRLVDASIAVANEVKARLAIELAED